MPLLRHVISHAVIILAAALVTGCATVVKGGSQPITVKTDPSGASCELSRKGTSLGVVNPTPGTLQVSKSATDLDISCAKPGYLTASSKLTASFQGWTLGNAILGGLIGVVVDAASGAMSEYGSEVSVKMIPDSFASVEARDAFFDAWRDEVQGKSQKDRAAISAKCSGQQCDAALKKEQQRKEASLAEVESARTRARIVDGNGKPPAEGSPASTDMQDSRRSEGSIPVSIAPGSSLR